MPTPDIVTRNFFALMRCAVLHQVQPLEPMSLFKWKRLFTYAANKHVEGIVQNALMAYQRISDAALPPKAVHTFQIMHGAAIVPNVMQMPETWLSNWLLNRHLKRIRRTEQSQSQPDLATLHALNIILHSFILLLNQGLSLGALLCLAKYVHTQGPHINYDKLNQWLSTLGLNNFAQLLGSMLVLFMGLDKAQLPFVKHINPTAYSMVLKTLSVPDPQNTPQHIKVWQSHLGIVHNNSTLLSQSFRHTLAYAHLAPLEAVSNYLHNIKQNLANLEE